MLKSGLDFESKQARRNKLTVSRTPLKALAGRAATTGMEMMRAEVRSVVEGGQVDIRFNL